MAEGLQILAKKRAVFNDRKSWLLSCAAAVVGLGARIGTKDLQRGVTLFISMKRVSSQCSRILVILAILQPDVRESNECARQNEGVASRAFIESLIVQAIPACIGL